GSRADTEAARSGANPARHQRAGSMRTEVERDAGARLAYSTLACPGWSLERVVAAAGEYGYRGVELRLIDGATIEPDLDAARRRRVRALFEAAALPIVAVDTSIRLAGADLDQAARDIRAFLDLAVEWGTPLIRVFGG